MGRFVNQATGVTFSVDDSKDGRYGEGFKPATAPKAAVKPSSKPSTTKK